MDFAWATSLPFSICQTAAKGNVVGRVLAHMIDLLVVSDVPQSWQENSCQQIFSELLPFRAFPYPHCYSRNLAEATYQVQDHLSPCLQRSCRREISKIFTQDATEYETLQLVIIHKYDRKNASLWHVW